MAESGSMWFVPGSGEEGLEHGALCQDCAATSMPRAALHLHCVGTVFWVQCQDGTKVCILFLPGEVGFFTLL